jgi:hypothetical protein
MTDEKLQRRLAIHLDDYARTEGKPFEHFFCPILLRDDKVDLCLGHIINQTIPGSCRKTVVQRTDVDGLYGAAFEPDLVAFVKARDLDLVDLLTHKDRRVRPRILLDGKECGYYHPHGPTPPGHTKVGFYSDQGKAVPLILKNTAREIGSTNDNQWNIVQNVDYRVPVLVSLIKAAYLTMFRLLGYRYAISAGGMEVGYYILGQFFRECGGEVATAKATATDFFRPFVNMVRPVESTNAPQPLGTVENNKFGMCYGSSGNPWALLIFVRTGSMLHAVLMPAVGNADSVEVYQSFLKNDTTTLRVTPGQYNPSTGRLESLDPVHALEQHWPKSPEDYQFPDEDKAPGPPPLYGPSPN